MKKATMINVLGILNGATPSDEMVDAIKAEIEAELNKGEAVKAENAKLYDTAKAVVMSELNTTDKAVTIGELYDAVAGDLPEGFTKGKLQYAVTRLWKDEIVRIEGKVNTYRKA